MSFRPLVLRVLSIRSPKNVSIQKSKLFQENYNIWIKDSCPPCAFISSVKSKTIELLKKKQNIPTIELWKGVTIEQLADIFETDVDTITSYIPKDLVNFKVLSSTRVNDQNILSELAKKFGKKCIFVPNPHLQKKTDSNPDLLRQPPSKPENLVKRPPVVTIMGHVDHGKTTLLDALRNSFVVQQEFGGITQHIGAFSVEVKSGDKITFIDTPGHAAFTAMRSRGAEVTDIVVLVIAADDGIMDQTIESINIANRAGVPIIVAVNKIDKPNALSLDQIKDKLLTEGIQVEDKGGNVQLVAISALKKINLDVLVEVILVEAEMMSLKGDPTGLVEGVVIESKTDKKGKQATIIVKRGTLKKGKIVVAGKALAKVRSILNDKGIEQEKALPSTPVQILGWKELPASGDEVFEVKSEKEGRQVIKSREREEINKKIEDDASVIKEKYIALKEEEIKKKIEFLSFTGQNRRKFYYENFLKKPVLNSEDSTTSNTLNIIIKGDVHGSIEVLVDVIGSYSQNDECNLNIIEAAVGDVKENDVELAEMSNGLIYAFNVEVNPSAKVLLKEKKIDVHFHNVLYKLIDDLKSELTKRIPPKDEEEVLGEAEVLEHFAINIGKKKVPVAGSRCVTGELKKGCLFKIVRDDEVIYDGNLVSMKHFKTEVGTIVKNTDCGLMFESFSGVFKPGDKIICYRIIQVKQKTSWDPGF